MKRIASRISFKIGIVIILVFTLGGFLFSQILYGKYKDIYLKQRIALIEKYNYYDVSDLWEIMDEDQFDAIATYLYDHGEEVKKRIFGGGDGDFSLGNDVVEKFGGVTMLFSSEKYASEEYDKAKSDVACYYLYSISNHYESLMDKDFTVRLDRVDNQGNCLHIFTIDHSNNSSEFPLTVNRVDVHNDPVFKSVLENKAINFNHPDPDYISESGRKILRVGTTAFYNDTHTTVLTRLEDWTNIDKEIHSSVFLLLLWFIIALALIAFLILVLLDLLIMRKTKRLRRALVLYENDSDTEKLRGAMEKIAKSQDEIGTLASELSNMTLAIDKYIEEESVIAAEKQKSKLEMSIAASIQRDNLLSDFDTVTEGFAIRLFASMEPVKEVGGDYYGCVRVDEDHIAFLIADVSDKGIPASLYMMTSKTMIENDLKNGKDPAETLNTANDALAENNDADMFVTVWLCLLCVSTGECQIVNAGHEEQIIKRPGGSWETVPMKHYLPVASFPDMGYENESFTLEKGTLVFVHTDGVTDAVSPTKDRFGVDRLVTALNGLDSDDPTEIINQIRGQVKSFIDEAEQFDDITMLCFRYE